MAPIGRPLRLGIAVCALLAVAPPSLACVPPQPTDLGTLDLGVGHRVRGVFFAPRDRPFRPCLHERLDTWITMTQPATFLDRRRPAAHGAVARLTLEDRSGEAPGRVAVRIRGRDGHYPVRAGDEPIRASVVVGDGAGGECTDAVFAAEGCRFDGRGRTLRCALR